MAEPNSQKEPRSQQSVPFDSGKAYLGTVYAKALLGVTQQAGNTAEVVAEFDSLVADVLDRLPLFDATISSLRVPAEEKLALLDKVFNNPRLPARMSLTLLNFLKVVMRHGRLDCLRAIHRALRQLYDALQGRVAVEIRTAHAVGADELALIADKLRRTTGLDVSLQSRVDPELLGGLVVRVGDTVYDGSVRNQLSRMREGAMDATLRKLRETGQQFVTN
jgi:F-type H+-transporting ATPase subunit delta